MANGSTEGKGCFSVALVGGGVLLAIVVVAMAWPMLVGVGVVALGFRIAKNQTLTDQTRNVLIISAVVVLGVAAAGEAAWLSGNSKQTTVQTASSPGPSTAPSTTAPTPRSELVGAEPEPTTTASTEAVAPVTEPPTTTVPPPPPTAVATLPPTTAAPVVTQPPPPHPPPTTVYVPPTTMAPAAGGGCNPNYSPCVPNASDVDCAGGKGNGPAYVSGPITVIGSDPYELDNDHDGIGCES